MKRRRVVDNDHLTLVVAKKYFGLGNNVRLVANYKLGIEEIVMSSETYYDHNTAVGRAKTLSKQLNVKYVVEE